MNWIVRHIVRTRNQAIGLLGGKPLFEDSEFEPHGDRALRLDELKQRFDAVGPALSR